MMSAGENTTIRSLHLELKQNFRLRMGLWLIGLIVLFYLALVQSVRVDDAHSAFVQQAERLDRAEILLGQDDWVSRAEAENAAFVELSARLWQAETLGLAQANLQGALSAITQTLNLRNSRMRSGTAQVVEGVDGLWQIQVQLDARYELGDELGLLYQLAQSPKLMIVERLDLQPNTRRLSLIVSGYFTGLQEEGL